jgi:hypothetical protein
MANKVYICKDSNGKKIYSGDIVELYMPWEMHSPWKSEVYWNPLDGAFVDAHPGHVKMKLSFHRSLREFLFREPMKIENEDNEIEILEAYCKKVKK